MTFKVKGGIQIGANVAFDSDALIQQIELTPSVRPSLLLDFAKAQTLDSRATFTRATTATSVGKDGIIRLVANGQPRIEFAANGSGICEGLLIETGKTNAFTSSEIMWDTTTWLSSNVNVIPNAATAPDGTMTATKIHDSVDAANTFHFFRSAGVSIANNTTYTFSIFVKAGELDRVGVYPIGGGNGFTYNITSNTIMFTDTGVTALVTPHANGWVRLAATITANADTTATPRVYTMSTAGTSYVGNNNGLYIWGAQWETLGQLSSYIPSRHTLTSRSTTATYIDNADGLIKTAAINGTRYNYNPYTGANTTLLIEPASTNVQLFSDTLDNGVWTKGAGITITANANTAPDGTLTADMVTKANSAAYAFCRQSYAAPLANTYNTFSVFVKKNNHRYVGLRAGGNPLPSGADGGRHATFDFDTESFVYAPVDYKHSFQRLNNGWYRLTATVMANTSSSLIGGFAITDSSGNEFWDSSANTALSVYAWGGQYEAGLQYATSYIPTVASSVTRAADVYTSATTSRSAEYATIPITSVNLKPYEGTIAMEGRVDGDITNNQYLFSLGDGTVNSLISFKCQSNNVQTVFFNRGVSQGTLNHVVGYVPGTPFKIASSFSNTGWVASTNGVRTDSVNGINLYGIPPYGTITIGGGFTQARRVYFKNIAYYPKKLSNNEINSITSS